MSNVRYYHKVFFAANGFGPYPCYGCDELIFFPEVMVHHLDHNKENNDPKNLVPIHRGCHNSIHRKGVPLSDAHVQALRDAARPRLTEDHKAKISISLREAYARGERNRTPSPEVLEALQHGREAWYERSKDLPNLGRRKKVNA